MRSIKDILPEVMAEAGVQARVCREEGGSMTTTTKERPILFNGAMVRAILAGTKTQTRRVVKGSAVWGGAARSARRLPDGAWRIEGDVAISADVHGNDVTFVDVRCPYGKPGDRLWVKETWARCGVLDECDPPEFVRYRADASCWSPAGPVSGHGHDDPPERWRPSIFMPRALSRLTLEVTGVRLERLQEISAEDIEAEGVTRAVAEAMCGETWGDAPKPRVWWQRGWDSLNAKRGFGWDTNPWVWVVEFRKVEA